MKKKYLSLTLITVFSVLFITVLTQCGYNQNNKTKPDNQPAFRQYPADNTLTDKEIADGCKLLFNGKTPEGWINARTGVFPSSGWKIENGILTSDPENKGENGGGDIVTTEKFGNFELTADFLYTPGGNSGIKYFVDTEADNGALASIGCEYQILDNKLNEDAKAGISGNHTLAALYDLIPPVNVDDKGAGSWNTAKIIVNGNKVQHWLNGKMTVEYERATPEWRSMVAKSKYKDFKGFGENTRGRILLQDHGTKVSFRNIKLREIK